MLRNPEPAVDDYALRYWRKPVAGGEIPDIADNGALSAEDFRLLADNLPTLCWMARADGFIFWYNRRWHDYCGTTPDAMEGWGWQSVHDPVQLPAVLERWSHSIETGEPFQMVFPIRGADGVFRRFLTRIVPVTNAAGNVVRWIGVNLDVEEQMLAEAALEASHARFEVLTDAMPQMVWSTLPDGYHDYYNAQWYEFTGVPPGSTDGEGWNGMFHEEDQARAWARWRHSLETGAPYEIEYRLRHHSGEYRWTLGRALPVRNPQGEIIRWIGTCTDIDQAKRDAEQAAVMSQELSHRIKNIFAVIGGLIGLSVKQEPESKDFAERLSGRIVSLGRAHDFARPHSDESRPSIGYSSLHGMLTELMRPYGQAETKRVEISGEDFPVDDKGATPIALAIHELATNAAKYGSISGPDGRILITTAREGEDIRIVWQEVGGPPLKGEPEHAGFGTRLSSISIEGQLGGSIVRDWAREGLKVQIVVKASRILRS